MALAAFSRPLPGSRESGKRGQRRATLSKLRPGSARTPRGTHSGGHRRRGERPQALKPPGTWSPARGSAAPASFGHGERPQALKPPGTWSPARGSAAPASFGHGERLAPPGAPRVPRPPLSNGGGVREGRRLDSPPSTGLRLARCRNYEIEDVARLIQLKVLSHTEEQGI